MSKWAVPFMMRNLLLAATAIPIVTASIALAEWARSDVPYRSFRNDVNASVAVHSNFVGDPPPHVDAPDTSAEIVDRCKQTADRWRNRLGSQFGLVVHEPFIIAGDLSQDELNCHYRQVIAPTVAAIENTLTAKRADEPVLVLLFSDEDSYRHHSNQQFGKRKASVYGYYKPSSRTVVINLASGLGTLVHELSHALFDFDFANMPLWLNEGIASLHEQAKFVNFPNDPVLVGEINWRYPILLDAINAKTLPTVQQLIVDKWQLRGGSREGLQYAYARYFCMYLQEQGKLQSLYKQMRDCRSSGGKTGDGLRTVEIVQNLFADSWETIDQDFQSWAIALQPKRTSESTSESTP